MSVYIFLDHIYILHHESHHCIVCYLSCRQRPVYHWFAWGMASSEPHPTLAILCCIAVLTAYYCAYWCSNPYYEVTYICPSEIDTVILFRHWVYCGIGPLVTHFVELVVLPIHCHCIWDYVLHSASWSYSFSKYVRHSAYPYFRCSPPRWASISLASTLFSYKEDTT